MTKKGKFNFIAVFYAILVGILILHGCAAMKSPEGGPRDTTPPKV